MPTRADFLYGIARIEVECFVQHRIARMLIGLIEERLGPVSAFQEAHILSASRLRLAAWTSRLPEAESVDELLYVLFESDSVIEEFVNAFNVVEAEVREVALSCMSNIVEWGRDKARAEASENFATLLLGLLETRFGSVNEARRLAILGASFDQLETYCERMHDAESLEDVLQDDWRGVLEKRVGEDRKTVVDALLGDAREEGSEDVRSRQAPAFVDFFDARYGPMTKEQRQRMESASVDEFEVWCEKAKTAESLEDIIGES